MRVVLNGKNMDLTPSLEHFATEKLSRLERYDARLDRVEVVIAHERTHEPSGRFTALATLIASGRLIMRGEDHAQTPQAAVDCLVDQLSQRLEREHAQKVDHHRRTTAAERRFAEATEGEAPIEGLEA
jgi:ribosomal subunit interface protein